MPADILSDAEAHAQIALASRSAAERIAPRWRPGLRLRATWAAARQAGHPAIATASAALLAAILSGGA